MSRTRLLPAVFLLLPGVPGASRAEEPRAVIERAIKAVGGEELLSVEGATVIKVRGELIQPGPNQKLAVSGTLWNQASNKRRYTLAVELGGAKFEVTQVVADGKGWRTVPGGPVEDIPPEELRETTELMEHDRAGALLPLLRDKGYTLTLAGEEKVEGRPAVGVKAAYKDKPDTLLYFDKASGLLVKHAYKNKQGKLQETLVSDYREPGLDRDERTLRGAGLTSDAAGVLAYLRRQTPDAAKVARVKELVRKLGDDSFEVREQAAKDLVALEKVAVPFLQQARKDRDIEIARRAGECLEQISKRIEDATLLAAVRLVAWKRLDGGAEALLALLPTAEEAVAREAKAALVVFADRGGKPDPALLKALDDPDPIRRAAAAAVLGKDAGAYLKEPGRPLFVSGLKQPMRSRYFEDGRLTFELEVTDYRAVNRLDDKLFQKPGER